MTLGDIRIELRDLTIKRLIPLDKAKVTIISENSNSKKKSGNSQFVNHKIDHKKKIPLKNVVPIDSIEVGMVGFQVIGEVSSITPQYSNGKDTIKAEIYDFSGYMDIKFWWPFNTLKEGDRVVVTYAKCALYRDEPYISVSENKAYVDNDSDDDSFDDLDDDDDIWEGDDDE